MKPSSDIDLFTTTLPVPVLMSLILFLRRALECSRHPFRRFRAAILVFLPVFLPASRATDVTREGAADLSRRRPLDGDPGEGDQAAG
jgi:hypothetical protein